MTIFTCDLELNYRHTQLKWDKNKRNIFFDSAHTHTTVKTHTVNTHPEQWVAIYAAAAGEKLGVRCLAQEYLSRGIEVERERCTFTPPTEKHAEFYFENLVVFHSMKSYFF